MEGASFFMTLLREPPCYMRTSLWGNLIWCPSGKRKEGEQGRDAGLRHQNVS